MRNLSAPKMVTFWVAVALMAFGVIGYFTDIVEIEADTAVMILTGGAILLTLSTMLKNL
jgi:hypothetical protein